MTTDISEFVEFKEHKPNKQIRDRKEKYPDNVMWYEINPSAKLARVYKGVRVQSSGKGWEAR